MKHGAPAGATVELRAVDDLKPHPLNERIYGDHADDELIARVQMLGIIHPLLIAHDGTVISGHRRLDAATRLGLSQVPVLVSPLTDPLDLEELLIEANRQRQPSNEQRVREYQHLKTLRLKRSARGPRLPAAPAEPVPGPDAPGIPADDAPFDAAPSFDPPPFAGDDPYAGLPPAVDEAMLREARREAASLVGGRETVLERGAEVVERIDRLEQEAQAEAAEDLRRLLNQRSVSAAWKSLQPEEPAPEIERPPLGRMRRVSQELERWVLNHPDDARAEKLQQAVDALQAALEIFAE
ncbi:MAG: ParB N-terminal domain-containing protein [Myxococcales bacterium]|nr:ParB N-terminal domain-containing protein [Myxococcales bacterium]